MFVNILWSAGAIVIAGYMVAAMLRPDSHHPTLPVAFCNYKTVHWASPG